MVWDGPASDYAVGGVTAHQTDDQGGMEGSLFGEHGGIPEVHVLDRAQVLRRGHRGDTGGGRHHLLTRGEGEHHQQLRQMCIRDSPWAVATPISTS